MTAWTLTGIDIDERTVSRLLPKPVKPPSQTWRTFLENHACDIVSIDFFTVPTVAFRVLFVLIVLSHQRRRVVHFNVAANPAAFWTAQQLLEAFPDDSAPRYLLRDRDGVYGTKFQEQVSAMGVREVLTAPRSPWQNLFAERVIGSIRRECLDHVIVLNRRQLRRILNSYFSYYHRTRTHLSLNKDAPEPREKQRVAVGDVVEFPEVGGLHHRYERRAASARRFPASDRRRIRNDGLQLRAASWSERLRPTGPERTRAQSSPTDSPIVKRRSALRERRQGLARHRIGF